MARAGGDPLHLRATQEFHLDDHPQFPGERKVVTDAYAYTLSESPELADELLAEYHRCLAKRTATSPAPCRPSCGWGSRGVPSSASLSMGCDSGA